MDDENKDDRDQDRIDKSKGRCGKHTVGTLDNQDCDG